MQSCDYLFHQTALLYYGSSELLLYKHILITRIAFAEETTFCLQEEKHTPETNNSTVLCD